jgi:HSP20 family molecular chaperone IbpA
VTDKDGLSFEAPTSPISFTVEPMVVALTAPEIEEEEVDPKLADITISYNVPIKEDTVNATSVTLKEKGGAAVPGIEIEVDGSDIVITLPMAGLKPETDYTVTVTDAVTDLYGVKGSEGVEFTFTTDKAAMP